MAKEFWQNILLIFISYYITYLIHPDHRKSQIDNRAYNKEQQLRSNRKLTRNWHQVTINKRKRIRKRRRYITQYHKRRATKIGNLGKKKLNYKDKRHQYKMFCYSGKEDTYHETNYLHFDTDSFQIGIDNHSSRCISPNPRDFIGPIQPSNNVLNGIAGSLKVQGIGTIIWKIRDDNGKIHEIKIKECLYIPQAKTRLFSPQ